MPASWPRSTVNVGTTTTLAPGNPATVVNVGNSYDAVLDFGIPQGATGATGAQGPQGIQGPTGATGPGLVAGATLTVNPLSTGVKSVAHGLGQLPVYVSAWLTCLTTNGGYAVGDILEVDTFSADTGGMGGGYDGGIAIAANSTTLYALIPTARWGAITKTASGSFQITAADWRLDVVPYKIA